MTKIRPRKQFGQHWLRSDRALQRILAAADLSVEDTVLEIGPGRGVLTRSLLDRVKSLLAIEIDRDLYSFLQSEFSGKNNLRLVQGDFLGLELEKLLTEEAGIPPNKVVANIPYNITGPILEKLLGTIAQPNPKPFELIVLLVQKEVADRLAAQPNSSAYGGLSVRVQYLAQCELICTVPAGAFYPPPKVDSAVIRLRPYHPPTGATHPAFLDQLVRMGFATRRKMLRNNLKSVVERDRLSELLQQLDLNPQARAEDLSLSQWINLSNLLEAERSPEQLDRLGY